MSTMNPDIWDKHSNTNRPKQDRDDKGKLLFPLAQLRSRHCRLNADLRRFQRIASAYCHVTRKGKQYLTISWHVEGTRKKRNGSERRLGYTTWNWRSYYETQSLWIIREKYKGNDDRKLIYWTYWTLMGSNIGEKRYMEMYNYQGDDTLNRGSP